MSIEYRSTRGQDPRKYKFTDALLASTAADGGLLVPENLPKFSLNSLSHLCSLSYAERVQYIINIFQPNLDNQTIGDSTKKAYGNNFDHVDVAPIENLKANQYIQELWHGPTSAFKDMALQLMPLMFSKAVEYDNKVREEKGKPKMHYIILTATSGDTGKAALEGYKDLPSTSIIVFYPHNHVSKLQELQMKTQEGNNVMVNAIRGDFDSAQNAVKNTFNDNEFKQMLEENNILLSSANSINLGRILPQIAYHISGYVELARKEIISLGDKIDIAVPTGNFGNLLAAFYAKQMGLPIGKLICASNENNVLTEFLETGTYDIRSRNLIRTPSPSMDILIASNVERLLDIITKDSSKVNEWMSNLKTNGVFKVDKETTQILKDSFFAGWVSNSDCLTNIKYIANETGYLMDPHTSVAQTVAQKYLEKSGSSRVIVICSTAHWAKFAKDVRNALVDNQDQQTESEDEFIAIEEIKKIIPHASEPKNIAELADKPILHDTIFDATTHGVENAIMEYLKKKQELT